MSEIRKNKEELQKLVIAFLAPFLLLPPETTSKEKADLDKL